jgi:hypothetical protein
MTVAVCDRSFLAYTMFSFLSVVDLLVKSCVSLELPHLLVAFCALALIIYDLFLSFAYSGIGFSIGVVASVVLFRRA